MRLPPELSRLIDQEIVKTDRAELSRAAVDLSQRYRAGQLSSPAVTTQADRAAYLTVRVPATFAANANVLSEIRRLAPEATIEGMLDLGAGPGTSMYAAAEVFPLLKSAALVEGNGPMIDLGRRLSQQSSNPIIRGSTWFQRDLNVDQALNAQDLVVISYTLNELSRMNAQRVVARAWQSTRRFLAIIEPGTTLGFALVHAARAQLIAAGAQILAPCPHARECPMAAAGDWCHFAQRVARTSLHRQLKGAALGHEDEKFSYVVASRSFLSGAEARIVRHPQRHSGHVQLLLCLPKGLEQRTVTKSQKDAYKRARKAEWGETWVGC